MNEFIEALTITMMAEGLLFVLESTLGATIPLLSSPLLKLIVAVDGFFGTLYIRR